MPTSKSKTKTIGITIGDPSGIGPEVVAKALAMNTVRRNAKFAIIGDYSVFKRYRKLLGRKCTFINVGIIQKQKIPIGKKNKLAGIAAYSYLKCAQQMLLNKEIDALVTAPVNKENIAISHPKFVGHTEFLAQTFKCKSVGMLFVTPTIKSLIVTRHIPLKKVSRSLSKDEIVTNIAMVNKALKKLFKIKSPRIAVSGLNPHAGENGQFGEEEIQIINPAIAKAQKSRIKVFGSYAADTLFTPQNINNYDAFITMYHDQGLTPLKTIAFDKVVNLTIGLPIIRTSPSHGTAFDIAGKNKANPSSMAEAIKLAKQLS